MIKQDLKGILTLSRIIDSKIRQLDDLKERGYGVKAVIKDITGVRGTKVFFPTENTAVDILALSESIVKDLDNLTGMKNRVRERFNALNSREILLMELRYMEGRKWKDVARVIGSSLDNVYRIHGEILKKIQ